MADDIVNRLRAAARSGDFPLGVSFNCDAVADEIERLRALIGQVLDCPINHQGYRSTTDSVVRYTAKRIDDSLLDTLKQEVRRER